MPTYDYICSNCGKTSEIVHSINGGPPAACPACAAVGTLRKAFNPPTIHFKGSGWAKKDRSSAPTKRSHSSDASSSNGSGSDGDSAKSSSDKHDGAGSEGGSSDSTSSSTSDPGKGKPAKESSAKESAPASSSSSASD